LETIEVKDLEKIVARMKASCGNSLSDFHNGVYVALAEVMAEVHTHVEEKKADLDNFGSGLADL